MKKTVIAIVAAMAIASTASAQMVPKQGTCGDFGPMMSDLKKVGYSPVFGSAHGEDSMIVSYFNKSTSAMVVFSVDMKSQRECVVASGVQTHWFNHF